MGHYYRDFTVPPPFGHSLPGAIGYVSKGGLIVHYGIKQRDPVLDLMIDSALAQKEMPTRGWPDGDNIRKHKVISEDTRPKKVIQIGPRGLRRKGRTHMQCCICDGFKCVTKHHLTPKQLRNMPSVERGIKWVCRPCHNIIHIRFTNYQLLETHWPDVVEIVRATGKR